MVKRSTKYDLCNFISSTELPMHGILYSVTLCQLTCEAISKANLTNNV